MAICFIEKVVNDHPNGRLTFQFHDPYQHPKDKATGETLTSDVPVVVLPGQEHEYEELLIPWDNAVKQHLLVMSEINGKVVQHRFNIFPRPDTSWDYVRHFNSSGQEVACVEAGTQGNAKGINWSGWELWLDSHGKVILNRTWRQGTSFKDAVLIGVGVAAGVVGLAGVILGGAAGVATILGAVAAAPVTGGATLAPGVAAGLALATGAAVLGGVPVGLMAMGVSQFVGFWSVLATSDPVEVQADMEKPAPSDPVNAQADMEKPRLLDVAAGKPAAASSTYSPDFAPAKANDGGSPASGGWSPAAGDAHCFWQVDLGQPRSLNGIQLVTRQDLDQPETRRNFEVWASNDPDMSKGHVVLGGVGEEAGRFQSTFNLQVLDPTPYRYVAAVKTKPEYFFIAKLHVFARSTDLAAGKPASASSTYSPDFAPSKANDGGSPASGGWSPAAGDAHCFWQVDLGEARPLSRVDLVTRQDLDQPETRQNFEIWASNDPDMSKGHVVLAAQGPRPRPLHDVFMAEIADPTPYRYIAAVKTRPEYFFIAKLCVYGR